MLAYAVLLSATRRLESPPQVHQNQGGTSLVELLQLIPDFFRRSLAFDAIEYSIRNRHGNELFDNSLVKIPPHLRCDVANIADILICLRDSRGCKVFT